MQQNSISRTRSALAIYNQSPHAIYWRDTQDHYTLMNDNAARIIGFDNSEISYASVTDDDLPLKIQEQQPIYTRQDQLVMREKKNISILNFAHYENFGWKFILAHKYPRFDEQCNLLGMGCTGMDITNQSALRNTLLLMFDEHDIIAKSLEKMQPVSLMIKDGYDDLSLTEAESRCLFLIMRGRTAKESAKILGVSFRTVETHLQRVKEKLGCDSRSQIIEKALVSGAGTIIPSSMFTRNLPFLPVPRALDLVMSCVSSVEDIVRLLGCYSETTVLLTHIAEKGWFFCGKNAHGHNVRDYVHDIPQLADLATLLYKMVPKEALDLNKNTLMSIITGAFSN